MNETPTAAQFEEAILPHLDAAYNLARWLTGNDDDARDVAQEASLRAFKFFGGFRGGNARAWLLTIVRNTFYNWLEKNRPRDIAAIAADDELLRIEDVSVNPELLATRCANVEAVRAAIERLPVEYREVVVLRELEDYSYKEIAGVSGVPIGTVMSRLARARKQLQEILTAPPEKEARP
ncbi:MAG TPA: sigma-70 family RNA polymerase sigma factor [Chthoniobacteraceae bacterium]|nr:sigma-70 family RNA polymerase sigma factor [Chthoniobacteraceae bacterium]